MGRRSGAPGTGTSLLVIERLATIRAIATIVATIVVAIALVARRGGPDRRVASGTMGRRVLAEAARAQAAPTVVRFSSRRARPLGPRGGADEQLLLGDDGGRAVVAASPNMAGRPVPSCDWRPVHPARCRSPHSTLDESRRGGRRRADVDGLRIVLVGQSVYGRRP